MTTVVDLLYSYITKRLHKGLSSIGLDELNSGVYLYQHGTSTSTGITRHTLGLIYTKGPIVTYRELIVINPSDPDTFKRLDIFIDTFVNSINK